MNQFAQDIAVARVAAGHYRGELVEGWRVGAVPNGGYVMAVAGQALREALPHKDPLSVSAFYLTPTALGPIDCRIEVLGGGRSTSFAEVKMFQQGELKVKVMAAYTDLDRLKGESWSATSRPEYPAWDDCPPSGDKGVEFRQRAELRLVSGQEIFSERRGNGSGEFQGWVRHRDGSAPDVIALLMFADASPPPVLTVFGPVGWVPTVELTVQVRGHPAPGPIQFRTACRHLSRGVVEADGEYWDCNGRLVAISRQTAKFRMDTRAVSKS
ncbi:MAG: thioesterase family protein [Halioglobus sp.]|nr:thioesterase family protein [Halioglobus sp.]